MRCPLGIVLLAWLLGAPSSALADTFTLNSIKIRDPDNPSSFLQEGENNNLNEFFNLARCICQTPVTVVFSVNAKVTGPSQNFTIAAGQNCLEIKNATSTASTCEVDLDYDVSQTGSVVGDKIEAAFPANKLMADSTCTKRGASTVELAIYVESEGKYSRLGDKSLKYNTDIEPPSAPQASSAPQGGEGRATVKFESTDSGERISYQLLCIRRPRGGGSIGPWTTKASFSPAFLTPEALCNKSTPSSTASTTADAGVAVDGGKNDGALGGSVDARASATDSSSAAADATTPTAPSDLLMNHAYLCSGKLTGAGEESVEGLESDYEYGFYAVSIDKVGNASQPVFLGWAASEPAQDLWERYRSKGGAGTGGYHCAVAQDATVPTAWLIVMVGCGAVYGVRRIRARRLRGGMRVRPNDLRRARAKGLR